MAYKVAIATTQAAWECRWARAGRRLLPDPERDHPELLWICVRPTTEVNRRVVSEAECDECQHWQVDDDA